MEKDDTVIKVGWISTPRVRNNICKKKPRKALTIVGMYLLNLLLGLVLGEHHDLGESILRTVVTLFDPQLFTW